MNEQARAPDRESKTSVDYVRKLHQQIVQKDNIIKLLQLQVKNLEGGGDLKEEVERLTRALKEAEEALAQRQDEGSEDLSLEVESLRRELETRTQETRQRTELEGLLKLREEELERHKAMLQDLEDETLENRDLAEENFQLKLRLGELENLVDETRGGEDLGPEDSEKLADLEAALSLSKDRIRKLEADLGKRTEKGARATGLDIFRLRQLVIEAVELVEDHDAGLIEEEEFRSQLHDLLASHADQLGLERIETVGLPFDEEVHALGRMIYSKEGKHRSIVAEESPGYRADGRVLKLAQVTVVSNPFHCEDCGNFAVEGAAFCHHCGSRVPEREIQSLESVKTSVSKREIRRASDGVRKALSQGDLEAAQSLLQDLEASAGEDPGVRVQKALVQEARGDFPGALETLEALSDGESSRELSKHVSRLRGKVEIYENLRRIW